MNEIQVQAQITVMEQQRNAALNTVVNLCGEIAVLQAKVKELEGKLVTKNDDKIELVGDTNA